MATQNPPEVRKVAKEYMIGKQYKAKFLGSLTITDAKDDTAESLKFLRVSNLTSESKQPLVIICLKLKGISVFGGPTKFAILEAPIERVTYVCHDPEMVTTFGIVIRTKDRGLRLHGFQAEQMTAISFVHSSQELFQLAFKIVKAKQRLNEQVQKLDEPPTYANVMLGTHPTAATNGTLEAGLAAAGVMRRKKTSVEGTSAIPRPSRRSSMCIPDQQKEVASLSRRATMYSPDQRSGDQRGYTASAHTAAGVDMFSHLSPPRHATSAPGYAGPTIASYAQYANVSVVSPPSQEEVFAPKWQSSPLAPITYQSPVSPNQTPLSAGSVASRTSWTSVVLPNPSYSSVLLTPSPQNAQRMAQPSPALTIQAIQFSIASPPDQDGFQGPNIQNRAAGVSGSSLASTTVENEAAKDGKNTGSRAGSSSTDQEGEGGIKLAPNPNSGPAKSAISEPCPPGRDWEAAFDDSIVPAPKPDQVKDTQPYDPSSLSLKGDLPLHSGSQPSERAHASAGPFEDNFLPPPQPSPNVPADATDPTLLTHHTFEDSFVSPSSDPFLTGDTHQTLSFEDKFQVSLIFNSFEDNFQSLESPASGQKSMFEDSFVKTPFSGLSKNIKSPNHQSTSGFDNHFVQ